MTSALPEPPSIQGPCEAVPEGSEGSEHVSPSPTFPPGPPSPRSPPESLLPFKRPAQFWGRQDEDLCYFRARPHPGFFLPP